MNKKKIGNLVRTMAYVAYGVVTSVVMNVTYLDLEFWFGLTCLIIVDVGRGIQEASK